MFRTIARSVLMALPVTALSVGALAQTAAPQSAAAERPSFYQLMLKKMDTNGDGRISLDEYVAAAQARFKGIDTQNKGAISAEDIAAAPATLQRDQKIAGFIVKHMDADGKGFVSEDDFIAKAKQRFARMDTRGDGKLTPDELTAPHLHAHAKFAQSENPDGQQTGIQQKRAEFAQKYFETIDANHDGVVTQDEYIAAAAAHFNKIDTNGSGEIGTDQIASSPRMVRHEQRTASNEVKRMDADGDGTVSQAEYITAAKARFAKLDTNGDGFIDASEMPAHHWAHAKQPSNGG
ncbi:MAG TPA: EF-hand domain-containing protein [Rudaea sp.]|jgi:Ca2+-binding EF-hand superfamily protein|nr:EF-hand domain-containing protein [Rudaea sp.]